MSINPIKWLRTVKRKLTGVPPYRDRHLVTSSDFEKSFKEWGYYRAKRAGAPRILMSSGHGYGNVGDEAQCGACIDRWRRVVPDCRITLFSPNPDYTEALHGENCEWAPRVAWFRANTIGPYFEEGKHFEQFYFWLKLRLTLSAHMMRRGVPLLLCDAREARILQVMQEHDILHISGGGFLTGKTRSRLWENCLLMRICQILDIPYILTGHNIGVFQDEADKKIANMGLVGANYIGLRDRGISEQELADIGIEGKHIESTADDALICSAMGINEVNKYLADIGVDVNKPWVAVNFHHWGQNEDDRKAIEERFSEICDQIVHGHNLQVVLIAMTPTDVEPERNISNIMEEKSFLAPYSPDYRIPRGIIAHSEFVLTFKHHPIVFAQGEGIPIVAIALDDYYYHKNKGALDNTGHGEYLVNSEDFNSNRPEFLVAQVLLKKSEISRQMTNWTGEMSELELKPYRNALVNFK